MAQRRRHGPRMAKSYTDTLPRELGGFVAAVGGVRAASKILAENAGTIVHIARGTRKPSKAFRARFYAIGWRPDWFRAGALAILEWAEQPPPRAPWPRRTPKGITHV